MRLLSGLVLLVLIELALSAPKSKSRHREDSSEELISKSKARSRASSRRRDDSSEELVKKPKASRQRDDSAEELVRKPKPRKDDDAEETKKTLVGKKEKPAGVKNNEQNGGR